MGRRVSTVEGDGTASAATDEIAYAQGIKRGGPAVSVQGSALAGLDDGIEDAHAVVLEEELVVLGCGGEGIEFGGPRLVRHNLPQVSEMSYFW